MPIRSDENYTNKFFIICFIFKVIKYVSRFVVLTLDTVICA